MGPSIRHGVLVIPLEAELAVATEPAHETPSKPGGAPSVKRGFELRRPIAAEVLDRVDLHAVVQHDLQEAVLRELTRDETGIGPPPTMCETSPGWAWPRR